MSLGTFIPLTTASPKGKKDWKLYCLLAPLSCGK